MIVNYLLRYSINFVMFVFTVQLTTKVKAIRIRYRQALDSGRKSGHGRVVLLYFELLKSIWGVSPPRNVMSLGVGTSDVVEAVEPVAGLPDTGSLSMPSGERVAEDAAEMAENQKQRLSATVSGYRRERLRRKLPLDSVAQDLQLKRRLLQRLDATENEFVQKMGHWSSLMDRLNSNIELLVQHIVGAGASHYMPPCLLHNTHTNSYKTLSIYFQCRLTCVFLNNGAVPVQNRLVILLIV